MEVCKEELCESNEIHEDLLKEIDNIYENAPNTSNKAVRMASKALRVTGDNTFSDNEADAYLPAALRKGGNQ